MKTIIKKIQALSTIEKILPLIVFVSVTLVEITRHLYDTFYSCNATFHN